MLFFDETIVVVLAIESVAPDSGFIEADFVIFFLTTLGVDFVNARVEV